MAYKAATIIAICVFAFYVIFTTFLSVCWCIQRYKQRRSRASLEAQDDPSSDETAMLRTTDDQQRQSRTASMYSETRSVSSMFYEGSGRAPNGGDRNSVNSLLIPLQPVHSVEEKVADDRLSAKTGRSRASSVSTLRYYATSSTQEEPVPAIPSDVSAPS